METPEDDTESICKDSSTSQDSVSDYIIQFSQDLLKLPAALEINQILPIQPWSILVTI